MIIPSMRVHKRDKEIGLVEAIMTLLAGDKPWRASCTKCNYKTDSATWADAMKKAHQGIRHDCAQHPKGYGLAA